MKSIQCGNPVDARVHVPADGGNGIDAVSRWFSSACEATGAGFDWSGKPVRLDAADCVGAGADAESVSPGRAGAHYHRLRSRSRIWARRMERGGTVAGFAIIVVIVAGVLFRHSDTLTQIKPSVYLAGLLLAPTGFVLGYLSAWALGLVRVQRRAVSLETGSQNTPLVLGIILISFPSETQMELMIVPLLYGVTIVPMTALVAWLIRRIPVNG
jgi:hypothetical protein